MKTLDKIFDKYTNIQVVSFSIFMISLSFYMFSVNNIFDFGENFIVVAIVSFVLLVVSTLDRIRDIEEI